MKPTLPALACALGLLTASAAGAATVDTDAARIRAARAASNAGIAAHNVDAAAGHLAEDAKVLGSNGGLLEGVPAMRAAFGQSFSDPGFVTYVRTPERVGVNGKVAAETGRWRGVWKGRELSGPYLARWEAGPSGWRARYEMYVPTGCRGPGCPR